MDLTLEKPGDHLFIRSYQGRRIKVVEDEYDLPLLIGAKTLQENWTDCAFDALNEQALKPIFDLKPEIVLLGVGDKQVFLQPELMMAFYSREIGIEIMTLDAACRTFNILVGERRNAVAALMDYSSID